MDSDNDDIDDVVNELLTGSFIDDEKTDQKKSSTKNAGSEPKMDFEDVKPSTTTVPQKIGGPKAVRFSDVPGGSEISATTTESPLKSKLNPLLLSNEKRATKPNLGFGFRFSDQKSSSNESGFGPAIGAKSTLQLNVPDQPVLQATMSTKSNASSWLDMKDDISPPSSRKLLSHQKNSFTRQESIDFNDDFDGPPPPRSFERKSSVTIVPKPEIKTDFKYGSNSDSNLVSSTMKLSSPSFITATTQAEETGKHSSFSPISSLLGSGTDFGLGAIGNRPPTVPGKEATPLSLQPMSTSLEDILQSLKPGSGNTISNAPGSGQKDKAQNQMAGGGGDNETMTTSKPVKVIKKAVVVRSGPGTLQVPSHLIDEEELKLMTSSMKSLFENQLEVMEKSYLTQMDVLTQSNQRKEEMLREEIKTIHKDYEARLERFKKDLIEAESKLPQTLNQEISVLTAQIGANQKQILDHMHVSTGSGNDSSIIAKLQTSVQELSYSLERKLEALVHSIQASVVNEMKLQKEHFSNVMSAMDSGVGMDSSKVHLSSSVQNQQMDLMFSKIEALMKRRENEMQKTHATFEESNKYIQAELLKMKQSQKKLKDGFMKAVTAATTVSLQEKEGKETLAHSKKDRTFIQLKEFRKDLRRLVLEINTRNENIHNSQEKLTADQKLLVQGLQDVANFVQQRGSNFSVNPSLGNDQQNEFEKRLIQEERSALSETMTQVQAERRRLNEERIAVDRDKMETEREKSRVRDLELNLKLRLTEVDDIKKQIESIRNKEDKRSSDTVSQLKNLEMGKKELAEKIQHFEVSIQKREKKLLNRKLELSQEADYLQKAREHLICPNCVRPIKSTGLPRTQGDGGGLDGLNGDNLMTTKHLGTSKI